MRKTQVVRASNQVHSGLQSVQTVSGMTTFARQGCQALSYGSVEPLDKRGIERAASS